MKTEMERKVDQLHSQLQFWQGVAVDSILQDHCSSLNTGNSTNFDCGYLYYSVDLCFPLLENDGTCIEEPAVMATSAVSLLLIFTLTTVIVIQCLLIIRIKRSYRNTTSPLSSESPIRVSPNEAYGLATSNTQLTDLPVSLNEAYALPSITN